MVEALRVNTTALKEYKLRRELKEKITLKILMSKVRKVVGVSREGQRESGKWYQKAKEERI